MKYIAKYASKTEKISSVAREAFPSVLCDPSDQINSKRTLTKLMMSAVGQRDMSIQEVMQQILSIKLVDSTFKVNTTSLDGSRKLQLTKDGTLATEASLLDLYAKREDFVNDYPDILEQNFIQFAKNYYQAKSGTIKKTNIPSCHKHLPKLPFQSQRCILWFVL